MGSHKSRNITGVPDDNGSTDQLVGYESLKAQKPRMRGGVMNGSAMGNWACIYHLGAAHARALIALISMHHMPYHDSTCSENNGAELPLGSACHVTYSSTTLV